MLEKSSSEIFENCPKSKVARPLFATGVAAGFPTPVDDFIEQQLDLNDHLIRHPKDTYFVRVAGDSMIEAGIHDDDILVVDRSLDAKIGKIVIAVLDGELTVKRLEKEGQDWILKAENKAYKSIRIAAGQSLEIWGVVTSAIHKLY